MADKPWFERDFDNIDDAPIEEEVITGPIAKPTNVGQHTLLSYLIANYDAWALAEPIVKSTYFDDEYKAVVEYLMEHIQEYKEIPSIPIVRMKTGVQLDRYDDAQDARRTQWLIDEVETFCRHRATELEIRRASMAIRDSTDRKTLEQIYQNIKAITEISLQKDLGIEVHRDARTTLNTKKAQLTKPTNYKWLDRITGGGLPCPGMLMLPGSPGLGKSNMLTNLLCNYAEAGEFCVYISLELSEQRIFERVCSIMTNTNIRDIYTRREEVANELEGRLELPDGGLLYIKKMKMMGTTRSHINAYLKELYMREGRKPTVLGLDYIDLMFPMAPIRDLSNINQKDKYTSMEFYDLLEEWGLTGITPSQRIKTQADLDEWDMGGTAGGAPKNDISDYIIMLQRKEHELTGYVQKGRYGGDGCRLPFDWNVQTLKITDGPEEKFYALNPRWDPNFARKNDDNTAMIRRTEINKDMRSVQCDNVLASIQDRGVRLSGSLGVEEAADEYKDALEGY